MRHLGSVLFLALVCCVTGCDHATKNMVVSQLPHGHTLPLISGMVCLEQAHNTDSAFSLLSGILPLEPRLLLLKLVATLGVVFLGILSVVRFRRASMLERVALAVTLGGALGNAVDRWRWGYVVDFIRFEYWPTFNVADMALSAGAGLLLISAWRMSHPAVVPATQTEPREGGASG
jgi:signal peptidase II